MKQLRRVIAILLALLPAMLKAQQNKPLFSIPFQLIDNRPFIEVKVNQRIFHFILDTSSGRLLDKAAADSLGLVLNNVTIANGANGRRVNFWMVQVDSMRIGTEKLTKPTVQVTELAEIKQKLNLPYLDGIIGNDFLKNYIVEFDYLHGIINFYKSYVANGAIPFSLYQSRIPQITIQIDGQPATVYINTGDRNGLTLFGNYATQSLFTGKYRLSPETMTGYGLAGPIMAQTFSLKKASVGNKVIKKITANIPVGTSGFSVSEVDGSIGGEVLKNYKLIIDYPGKKLYLH